MGWVFGRPAAHELSVCRRLVSVRESGWQAFDVTEAVNFWQQLRRPRQPLLLQVSVQKELPGAGPADIHRLVRFAEQGTRAARAEPQLELHTLDLQDYGWVGRAPQIGAAKAQFTENIFLYLGKGGGYCLICADIVVLCFQFTLVIVFKNTSFLCN